MRTIALRLRSWLSRFRRAEDGTATVEFVLVVPGFLLLMAGAAETGFLMAREAMLQRGVDLAVRELRLGTGNVTNVEDLKDYICRGATILPDCANAIRVELSPIDTVQWTPTAPLQGDCVDRTEQLTPAQNYTRGTENELMVIRVCVIFDPIFPNYGIGQRLPTDESGGYALVAFGAFVNEPL